MSHHHFIAAETYAELAAACAAASAVSAAGPCAELIAAERQAEPVGAEAQATPDAFGACAGTTTTEACAGPGASLAGSEFELACEPQMLRHMRAARIAVGERFVLANGRGQAYELELTGPLPVARQTVGQASCSSGRQTASQPTNQPINQPTNQPVRRAGNQTGSKAAVSAALRVRVIRALGNNAHATRPQLTLVQGLAAADRMDLVVRQATELGVARIVFLISARTQQHLNTEQTARRLARFERIALSAAEQSGQLVLPVLCQPMTLEEALLATSGCESRVCCWEESSSGLLSGVVQGGSAAVFIGPEGGFTPDEVALMRRAGVAVVSLGSTILRTETAALVACALALSTLGALGPSNLAELPEPREPRA